MNNYRQHRFNKQNASIEMAVAHARMGERVVFIVPSPDSLAVCERKRLEDAGVEIKTFEEMAGRVKTFEREGEE